MSRVDAWAGVLKVHAALVPVLDRLLKQRHNLPITWYDVLLELNAAPDKQLTMTDLGERAVVSRTRVSRVVDELAREGLVLRETNPDDRRSSYAVLTKDGRARLREAAPTYLAGIEEHFSQHLSEQEAKCIARALHRVLDRAGPDAPTMTPVGAGAAVLPVTPRRPAFQKRRRPAPRSDYRR